ncbi:unnamed protein product [Linum trigynum]|uniref:C-JID domain-containing protein n=1 Tax=Linum trigynum TaxID=586398 RepID=A0AAV2FQP2_9ROSI
MKGLSQLQQLSVKNCRRLVTLPELPTMLSKLEADNCQSLARVSIYSADHMNSFDFSFTNCFSLDKIACKNILAYALLKLQHYSKGLRNQMSFLPAVESTFCCPGGKVPEWFNHHSSGHSLVMQLPSNWTSDGFAGLTICAVLAFEEHFYESGVQLKCTFHFSTQGPDSQALHHCYFGGSAYGGKFLQSNHLLFGYDPSILKAVIRNQLLGKSKQVDIRFYPEDMNEDPLPGCNVIACGARLLCAQEEKYLDFSSHYGGTSA